MCHRDRDGYYVLLDDGVILSVQKVAVANGLFGGVLCAVYMQGDRGAPSSILDGTATTVYVPLSAWRAWPHGAPPTCFLSKENDWRRVYDCKHRAKDTRMAALEAEGG